jgi:putative transposase
MTDDTIAELTAILGSVRTACKAAGRPQASHYRRHRQSPKPDKLVRDRRAQPRALTQAERDTVRAVLNSSFFVDKAPASVYHELLDEGVRLCSPSTMYRILRTHDEVKERRRQAVHPARVKPELVATQPNQCWSCYAEAVVMPTSSPVTGFSGGGRGCWVGIITGLRGKRGPGPSAGSGLGLRSRVG